MKSTLLSFLLAIILFACGEDSEVVDPDQLLIRISNQTSTNLITPELISFVEFDLCPTRDCGTATFQNVDVGGLSDYVQYELFNFTCFVVNSENYSYGLIDCMTSGQLDPGTYTVYIFDEPNQNYVEPS